MGSNITNIIKKLIKVYQLLMAWEHLLQILFFLDPMALKHPEQNLHHLNAMGEFEPAINEVKNLS